MASDVVFVFPPAHHSVGAFKNHLGVAYLRAVLAREGLTTTQYRQENPGTVHRVSDEILRLRPKVVGFTVYDVNLRLALAIAHRIKQKQSGVRIVFGGPTATFGATQILERNNVVDACVTGEAEETGPKIFKQLLDDVHLDPAQPGLAYRHNSTIVCSELPALVGSRSADAPFHAALDTTPSPYLSGILTDGRSGVLTSRGCTHHCQYCVFAALARKSLRLHSTERVLAELDFIANHQRHTRQPYIVSVHDDAFTLLPARAKALCRAIAERHLGLEFSCITRADKVDDELLRLMREAGFFSISFGLESAVPAVLRATGKVRPPDWPDPDLTPERQFLAQVRTSVLAAKRQGFQVSVSVILGLPSETREDGEATLRFIKTLPLNDYAHNFLHAFPGTPLWNTHDRYGIRCSLDEVGLATTTSYAYDVTELRPRPKCQREEDARLVQLLTCDALYGCEAAEPCRARINTVIASGSHLPADTAVWLGRLLDIGGLVVQLYPRSRRRMSAQRLYQDRCVIARTGVFPRYHTQLLPKAAGPGYDQWLVACLRVDLYRKHKPWVLSLRSVHGPQPLLEWLNGKPNNALLCDVADYLRRPIELASFLRDFKEGELGPQLRSMPFPPGLKYPGRWLNGSAPCRALTRLEVDDQGTVRTCRHGKPIGTVGDSKNALTQRFNVLAQDAERRRACASCRNTHCPRCPFPGLDDHVYCRIMTEQTPSLSLLNWTRLYSRLPLLAALQREKAGSD